MWRFVWLLLVCTHLAGVVHATPLGQVTMRQEGLVLSEFIRHYEPVVYDRGDLEAQHRRVRRAAGPLSPVTPLRLRFKAHNREFRLKLWPDPESVFADDAEFTGTGGDIDFDTTRVYSGTLEDDDSASVHGIITSEGLFDGTISTRLEHYYVEPVSRYGVSAAFHSVVYRVSDVAAPGEPRGGCASQRLHESRDGEDGGLVAEEDYEDDDDDANVNKTRERRWLPDDINPYVSSEHTESFMPDDVHDSMIPNDSPDYPRLLNPELPIDLDIPYTRNNDASILFKSKNNENVITKGNDNSRPVHKTHVEIITKKSNKKPTATLVASYTPNMTDFRHVNKRATVDPKKTTCMLYLQADHQFFQKFGTEEACIEIMTRHVQRVNSIYKVTDFNQDGKSDNITFMIKRIKVHTGEALKDPMYRFPGNYGVEKFLELFSEEDYDAFCLAYMFTYRDFEMGTLGLAWTGDLKNAGGVCEKNGHYRGSMKSLNTGIVTLLNYGKHVPPAVSHVTLAHEVGHNFGSPHDPEVCTPGGEDGNFIMFARATSGDKLNNNRFSPCSLKSINPVLNTKARSGKGCFTEPQVAICGNGVVDPGEECDCGWEDDCRDQCCHPQRRYPPHDEPPCRLTPRSVCSPSQGPCCTNECQLKFGDKCRDDNGCRDASYCGGRAPQCPPSINKPNKTICNDEFVCFLGECTGSICLAYGLESCQCIPGPEDLPSKICELCCKLPGELSPCISSFQWNEAPFDVPDMFSKPGTPCNNYNGYCDVFQKCREVDPSGPLATLRKLLLSEETLASIKKWVIEHWYAVALIGATVLVLLILSARLLSKKPNMKLKSVTIMHNSTSATVRLPPETEGGGQVIVHTAVRSKLPLKKKVREAKVKANKIRSKNKSPSKQRARPSTDQVQGNNNQSPVKTKKKKRVSAPVVAEESRKRTGEVAGIDSVPVKSKKPTIGKKKTKNKKEVIDYSAAQAEPKNNIIVPGVQSQPENDALGKVQQWLLESPQPIIIPKSKSTPVGLTQRSPSKTKTLKPRGDKSKSISNLNDKEKVRLQVVYKPPFKFSLKLCKSDHTKVLVDRSQRRGKERRNKDHKNKDTPEVHPENVHPTRTALLILNGKGRESKNVENELVDADDIAVNIINGSSSKSTTLQSNVSEQPHMYENLLMRSNNEGAGLPGPMQSVPVSSMKRSSKHNSLSRAQENFNIMKRQASQTNIPRAHSRQNSMGNLRRGNSTNNLHRHESASNLHRGNSTSTLHKNSATNLHMGSASNLHKSSANNLHSRQNSISKELPSGTSSGHIANVHSTGKIERNSSRKPNKLNRQTSANDLHLGHSRQSSMVNSDANHAQTAQCDSRRTDFDWPIVRQQVPEPNQPKMNNINDTNLRFNLAELCSDVDSNIQTIQSDLEVLLSDNEMLTDA